MAILSTSSSQISSWRRSSEHGGAGELVVGDVLRRFQGAVVLEVGGDAGGAEGVVADAGLDAGGPETWIRWC